jgi:hypothetical protein
VVSKAKLDPKVLVGQTARRAWMGLVDLKEKLGNRGGMGNQESVAKEVRVLPLDPEAPVVSKGIKESACLVQVAVQAAVAFQVWGVIVVDQDMQAVQVLTGEGGNLGKPVKPVKMASMVLMDPVVSLGNWGLLASLVIGSKMKFRRIWLHSRGMWTWSSAFWRAWCPGRVRTQQQP